MGRCSVTKTKSHASHGIPREEMLRIRALSVGN